MAKTFLLWSILITVLYMNLIDIT